MRVCEQCGSEYVWKNKRQRFCSTTCRVRYWEMNRIDIKIKVDKKGRVIEVTSRGREVDISKVTVEYENG